MGAPNSRIWKRFRAEQNWPNEHFGLRSSEVERVDFLYAAIANHERVALRGEPNPPGEDIDHLRKVFETYNLFYSSVWNADANDCW